MELYENFFEVIVMTKNKEEFNLMDLISDEDMAKVRAAADA